VRRTTIRVVCNNTLTMAVGEAPASVKVSHRSEFDAAKVKDFMGLNEAAWEHFRHQITRLANKPVVVEQAEDMTVALLGGEQDKVRTSAAFNKIMDLFQGEAKGSNYDGVGDSAWGYVNAWTEFLDHWTRARSTENRFVSSQWGKNAAMKDQVLAMVSSL
jgi:hypothetical protein